MLSHAKRMLTGSLTAIPVYRLLPPSSLRTYADIRYRGARADHQHVVEMARTHSAQVLEHYSTAIVAARAAFRTGNDQLLESIADGLMSRFPGNEEPFELRAELRRFQGRYSEAFNDFQRSRMLMPAKSMTVARVVTLAYQAGADDADEIALSAVRRFPRSGRVWWAAAKSCRTEEQRDRLTAVWHELDEPEQLPRLVRPLAAAAARTGDVESAALLYREAMTMLVDGHEPVSPVTAPTLEGRGAWQAIEALVDVLDSAGVPFFFAAGTALGLVREGRPLDLDGDIDVGIFEQDWNRDALQKLFETDSRFAPDPPHPFAQKLGMKHRAGSTIDLFRFYTDDGRVWHDSAFTRWHNSPFTVERQTIQGVDLPLPADADKYLTENYGDWRTPTPSFDAFTADAPNVESTWPEYSRFHLIRRAFAKLTNGDLAGALSELAKADERELMARLEATHG